MSEELSPIPPGRAVTRQELELVIRRAVDLATQQADAGDAISEDEVVRIAGEVGLSPQYVRRALFELPTLRRAQQPTLAARLLGECEVSAERVVPGDAEAVLRRVEQYLTTREYLLVRRQRSGQLLLAPADDAISKFARAITRSGRRFQLARASEVGVVAESADETHARVNIDVNLEEPRHDAFVSGGVLGTFLGLVGGNVMAAAGAGMAVALHAATAVLIASGVGLGIAGLAGGVWGGLAISRRMFHRRLEDAHAEADALLDRLEAGERLDPPTSPVIRRLRDRFIGSIPLR